MEDPNEAVVGNFVEWTLVGENYFSRTTLYEMLWNEGSSTGALVDLEYYRYGFCLFCLSINSLPWQAGAFYFHSLGSSVLSLGI